MMKKTVKRNTILNAFRMLLTVLVPLATIPYTSRIFQAEGIGKLNFASSTVELFTLLSTLSISTYAVREGTKVREDKSRFSGFAQEMLILNVFATVAAYSLFFLMIQLVPAFQSSRMLLLCYSFLIGSAALSMEWVCVAYEEYAFLTVRQMAVQITALFLLFTFVRNPQHLTLWVSIIVFTTVVSHIVTIFHVRKYVRFKPAVRSEWKLKRHLTPITLLLVIAFAGKVYSDVNTVLLGILTTDYHTGMYSASVRIHTILITCFTAMTPVFMPRIVELLERGCREAYFAFLKKIFSLVFAAGIPIVVGIEMLGGQIIFILAGAGFQEAEVTIRILAPAILLNACANILYYNFLVPYKKEKLVLLCILVTALINVALSLVLIPFLAQNGAAIGSLVSETMGLILALLLCRRQDPGILSCHPSVIRYVAGAVGIIVWCFLCKRLFFNVYMLTAAAVVGSIGIYGLVLIVLHDPVAEEGIQMLKAGCRKLRQ